MNNKSNDLTGTYSKMINNPSISSILDVLDSTISKNQKSLESGTSLISTEESLSDLAVIKEESTSHSSQLR